MNALIRKIKIYKSELAKAQIRNKELRDKRAFYGSSRRRGGYSEFEKTKLDVMLIALAA